MQSNKLGDKKPESNLLFALFHNYSDINFICNTTVYIYIQRLFNAKLTQNPP